jgi:SRSO17 transposase
VFLAYATPDGQRALIDRALYLPESWTADRDRCAHAGVPEEVGFATKPELARRMIERARAAEVPFGWVSADEAYGQNPPLRSWLEDRGMSVSSCRLWHRNGGALGVSRQVMCPDPAR